MNHVLTSWKTTLAGIILSVAGYVQWAYPQYAPIAQLAIAIAGGAGLIAAKDSNVSGQPKPVQSAETPKP